MNKITKKFITQFENKEKEEQEIIEEEILNYLTNYKNAELFEEIKKFVIYEANEVITNIDDYDALNEIVKKYGKNEIIQIIKNETEHFDIDFIALQLNYTYKIELRIKFNYFRYNYIDNGDIGNYGYNRDYYFDFDDDVNDDMKTLFKIFFPDYIVKDYCWKWLNKYKHFFS